MTNTTENPRPAGIYVRISQDRTGAGLGVKRQERECRALAERMNCDVVEVYDDNDATAYKPRRRKDYERMLADIEAGRITAVITWHTDRLTRRMAELARYSDICKAYDVPTYTVQAGFIDMSTAGGRYTAGQFGLAASYESDLKSERLKSARVQHAKMGKHHGGIRCYGYEKDGVTVVADEAAEIANACKSIASGASLRSIVRDMNSRGVPTTKGKTWTSQQLRQTLISPRIAGYSTHKGIIVGTAAWLAIVDDATWRAVEVILSNPARRTNPGVTGAAKWLGSGIYYCTCGERSLRASVSGGSRRYVYRCANSSDHSVRHVTRDACALDAYVEWSIVDYLEHPGNVQRLLHRDDTTDVAALRVEQVGLGERKDKAAAMFIDGMIDEVQLATITKRADERGKEIAGVLAKAGWRSPLEPLAGGNIEAVWATLTLAQRRPILTKLCDVTVLPTTPTTRGFDPDGVRIDWKVG